MKLIILTSILLITLTSCKAQQIITPIFYNAPPEENSNNYYKDVDNDFNKFVGTWKLQNTDTEFIIKLEKEIMINDNDGSYVYDMLIGEYFYKKNGVILINTLVNINNPSITIGYNNINGNSIVHKDNSPVCDTCSTEERRVKVLMRLPEHLNIKGWLTLRHIIDNDVEKLEATITNASIMGYEMVDFNKMPWGNFTLIKQ